MMNLFNLNKSYADCKAKFGSRQPKAGEMPHTYLKQIAQQWTDDVFVVDALIPVTHGFSTPEQLAIIADAFLVSADLLKAYFISTKEWP